MGLSHQEQLRQRIKRHADCNMIFGLVSKPGYDQAFGILISGTTVSNQKKIRFLTNQKLTDSGQALSIRSSLTVLAKLLCGGTSQPFLNGFAVPCLLLLLQDVSQLTAGQFSAKLQQFRYGDVDMDIIGLPVSGRLAQVIGCESKVCSALVEGI